jgi:hypothetical protein
VPVPGPGHATFPVHIRTVRVGIHSVVPLVAGLLAHTVRCQRLTVNDYELKVADPDRSSTVAQRAGADRGLAPEPVSTEAALSDVAETGDEIEPGATHDTHGTPT